MTRAELENKMTVLLGGRASEHLVFEHLSTGAADDLTKATDIARGMVTRYGMDEALGHVVYQDDAPLFLVNQGLPPRNKEMSNETAEKIDQAVRALVQAAFDRATAILAECRDTLEQGAALLLAKETLNESELAMLKQQLPLAVATGETVVRR